MPRYGKKENKKPLDYQPTESEFEAYIWGVNNGYIISPLGISGSSDDYRIGIATRDQWAQVKKDPATYPYDEVMQKVYEYYTYYYKKRKI